MLSKVGVKLLTICYLTKLFKADDARMRNASIHYAFLHHYNYLININFYKFLGQQSPIN